MIITRTFNEIDELIGGIREFTKISPGVILGQQKQEVVVELSTRSMKPDLETATVIVCSQIVDAGYDIKPGADILIDTGKETIIDRGIRLTPAPWSRNFTKLQREGRVGRLGNAIVFRPPETGTGDPDVKVYPAPSLFHHQVIAEHFKVPRLRPIGNPIFGLEPYFQLRKGTSEEKKKPLSFCALAILFGVPVDDLGKFYRKYYLEQNQMPEEYDRISEMMNLTKYDPYIRFEDIEEDLYVNDTFVFDIGHGPRHSKLIIPVQGNWITIAEIPEKVKRSEPLYTNTEHNIKKLQRQRDELVEKTNRLMEFETKHNEIKNRLSKDLIRRVLGKHTNWEPGEEAFATIPMYDENMRLAHIHVVQKTGSECQICKRTFAHEHMKGSVRPKNKSKNDQTHNKLTWEYIPPKS